MARKIAVNPAWARLLSQENVRVATMLRGSGLPEDLFSRARPSLEPPLFAKLWDGMEQAFGSSAAALKVGQGTASELLNPARLVVICSADLMTAFERLAALRALVGAERLEVNNTLGGLEVTVDSAVLPNGFILAELVSLVCLARLGLGPDLKPVAVELKAPPVDDTFRNFFGRTLRPGPFDRVVFTQEVAKRPMRPPMADDFAGFPEDLRARLDELDRHASVSDRVTSALMEGLPSGNADARYVAARLGTSVRSLQRRLTADDTRFNVVLQGLRTRLANYYLQDTELSGSEIAFLLGYDDPNSFIRAFHEWTGQTPEKARKSLAKGER